MSKFDERHEYKHLRSSMKSKSDELKETHNETHYKESLTKSES